MNTTDTIAAPATAAGEAALALLRVSGPEVPRLLKEIFSADDPPPPRQATLAAYRDRDGTLLDHLLYTWFAEGRSSTGEPLLELTPHGNPYLVRKILDDLLARGCRLAEGGEFTRRAFLNGRLDLSQAEGVLQLIRARSDRALQAARRQLAGSVGRIVDDLVERLLQLTAETEAYIDFPEEDLPPEEEEGPLRSLDALLRDIDGLIATRRYSDLLHDGIKCVILGEPNVGKSSLLNALTGEDRVLVSAEPGTTRDYVEERILIGPYLLRVIDTAGLHEAASALEEAGIARSREQIESADLLLVVLDATRPSPTLPAAVQEVLRKRQTLVLENKCDLAEAPAHAAFAPALPHLAVSATTGDGLPGLRDRIRQSIEEGLLIPESEAVLVSARHAHALADARERLRAARRLLRDGEATELVASEIHAAVHALGRITGKVDPEAVLDHLFASFCIGK